MPNVSKETASEQIAFEGIDVRLENFEGGYSVCFESHTADADLADLFRGLPDDRAQLPRWGYVIRGKVGFRFSDREETYEAGDAYYVPPGHTPVHYAGAEIVEFSPTEILDETIPVVMKNLHDRRGSRWEAPHERRPRVRDRAREPATIAITTSLAWGDVATRDAAICSGAGGWHDRSRTRPVASRPSRTTSSRAVVGSPSSKRSPRPEKALNFARAPRAGAGPVHP